MNLFDSFCIKMQIYWLADLLNSNFLTGLLSSFFFLLNTVLLDLGESDDGIEMKPPRKKAKKCKGLITPTHFFHFL